MRNGTRRPERDIRVASAAGRATLSAARVRAIVTGVLDGEGAGAASLSVTFVTAARIRAINRRAFGRRGETDVIAFGLRHPGRLAGDVYVCPKVARRSARALGIGVREEMTRLVVHGTLHVLGHNHPEGQARTASPMWRRQEFYLRRLGGRS